jgi:amidase
MTIFEGYALLQQNKLTASDWLTQSLSTERANRAKNSIGVLSPLAQAKAKQADDERKKGFYRGLLHGVPCLIKDNIMYADHTPTTANSYALKDFIPQTNAPIVNRLLSAGAVIVGKANLSEFAYFMGDEHTPSGYGSMYGQVKHPTNEAIDPYGSSTGSAVAVALGIVPFALGTETNGSLMAPAHQCQIVALKPTFGIVDSTGIIPISPTQDTAGPMAKTPLDCAAVMDVLVDDHQKANPAQSYVEQTLKHPGRVRIGILTLSNHPYSSLEKEKMNQIRNQFILLGWDVVELTLQYPPLENFETLKREFKVSLNAFLHEHTSEGTPKNLQSIIDFNLAHADRCLRYGQKTLLDSEQKPDTLDETFFDLKNALLKEASELDEQLQTHNLDAIVSLGWLSYAPIYGNPSLCTPEGWLEGQPKGLVWVGKKHDDGRLLQLGHTYLSKDKLSSIR